MFSLIRKGGQAGARLFAACMALLLTGCKDCDQYGFTHHLWTTVDVRSFSMPARQPNLGLYEDLEQRDVLVTYDELDEKKDRVTRRAYFLLANLDKIKAHKAPQYADTAVVPKLSPIPIVVAPESTNTVFCAVAARNGQEFVLYRPGKPEARYELPFYAQTHGTCTKVALTPLTVSADAIIVGSVIGVIVLCFIPNWSSYDFSCPSDR